MDNNQREFFRVRFNKPLEGEVSILNKDPFQIEIHDVSVKGLRFSSDVDLPLHKDLMCSFSILDCSFKMKGSIVRKSPERKGIDYGVILKQDPVTFSELFKQLNYYQIRKRKGTLEEV
ncbi:PilZ domain-containing protein [Planomicrobium sp. CPCC 101079]|uniref:PilZ domain-containing protein n=1 Tax=Planomicrobium sp. CPCC 101079 TaxID=2599618 RepID=UPI0011B3C592|nr:PilZ domain-containing protein [Planomicrobium sp. CPCC 101079]TWT03710.1 PilZ domain-containing protein [Planomicrobium sp. CPCC 101079]